MRKIKINIIQVHQPIGTFYIGKIKGDILYKLAKADIREIKDGRDYLGIQRKLDEDRVGLIQDYIRTVKASFPNSIILNVSSNHIISNSENELEFDVTDTTFSIIDGQHRLAGFENYDSSEFELVVAIFIDLDIEDQAHLFSTINSEQKRVNPSFKYDLEDYSSVKTPRRIVRDIAYAFNIDRESPWYSSIKMNGIKDELSKNGIISLSAFANPIIEYIYDDKKLYQLKDELYQIKRMRNLKDGFDINGLLNRYEYAQDKHIFWEFYSQDQEGVIYKILFNFFKAIQDILPNDWRNNNSILTKTTGYNAIMKLFNDVYLKAYKERDFSFKQFKNILQPMEQLRGQLTAQKYGASGAAASHQLYKELYMIIMK